MACRFCNLQQPCCYECSKKDCKVRCSGVFGNNDNGNKRCAFYSTYKAENKCSRM